MKNKNKIKKHDRQKIKIERKFKFQSSGILCRQTDVATIQTYTSFKNENFNVIFNNNDIII